MWHFECRQSFWSNEINPKWHNFIYIVIIMFHIFFCFSAGFTVNEHEMTKVYKLQRRNEHFNWIFIIHNINNIWIYQNCCRGSNESEWFGDMRMICKMNFEWCVLDFVHAERSNWNDAADAHCSHDIVITSLIYTIILFICSDAISQNHRAF